MTSTPPGPTSPLRPLGLGEVLDRAVSLSIRGAVLLSLIYLVLAVPRAIVEYFSFRNIGALMATVYKSIQTHPDPTQLNDQLQALQTPPIVTILGLLLSIVLLPLSMAALTIACTTVYFGGVMTFNQAYKLAAGRWIQLILLNIIWGATYFIIAIVLATAIALLAIGFGALAALFKTVGVIFAAIAAIAVAVFLACIALLFVLAWQLSVVTCVVERSSFIDAYISGSRRVLSGIGIRRSLLVGLVFALLYGGLGLAQALGTLVLVTLVKQPLIGTIYASLFSVVAQIVATAFMVIFYFDLRVREDGLDLELAMNASSPSVAPA